MKKKVPLAIRSYLDKVLAGNLNLIKAVIEKDTVVTFKEKSDPKSPFYFKVESVNTKSNTKTSYTVSFVPSNRENFHPTRHAVHLDALQKNISTWLELLKEYNKESIIFEDTITQKYYEELEPEIRIIDEDAETAPFNFKQQEFVLSFLQKAKNLIESNRNEENEKEANEIVEDIQEAEKSVSKSTKSENVSRIRKIIAKAYKFRHDLGKELLIEFTADLIKLLAGAAAASLLG